MYWTPEPIWNGRCVFVVGGGPSLRGFRFERLRNRSVLAINEAYVDVPWADVLFFRDFEWYDRVHPQFSGVVVTTDRRAIGVDRVNVIEVGTKDIPRARTGGHSAVALAMVMGAREIALLGFDWNPDGGNYHDRYTAQGLLYISDKSWSVYRKMAEEHGVDILNCTPDSCIKEFAYISYKDLYLL